MSGDAMIYGAVDDETRRDRAAERLAYWTTSGHRDRLIADGRLLDLGNGTVIEARHATEEHWLLAAVTDMDRKRPRHPTDDGQHHD